MKDDKMTRETGLSRRGGVYWLRVLIPDDLRHLYPRTSAGKLPTDRYRASLRTTDPRDAEVKAAALRAQFKAEFAERRKGLAPGLVEPAAPIRAIIAETVFATEVAADRDQRADKRLTVRMTSGVGMGDPNEAAPFPEVSRLAPLSPQTVAARSAYNLRRLEYVRGAVASGDLAVMIPIADRAAQSLGLRVAWDSDAGAETLRECLEAYSRARTAAIQRDAGAVIETPAAPKLPNDTQAAAKPKVPQTIRDLLPLWQQKTKPKPDALRKANRALDLLDDSGVNTVLATLTRGDGAKFRDWLRDSELRDFGHKTGRNHYRAVSALLNASLDYEAIQVNPWQGLSFPVEDSEERPPFTRDELSALFSGPLYGSYALPEGERTVGAAAYWLPLLGLWSGARVGELAQLVPTDIRDVEGYVVIDINNRAPGSTLKTANSARLVPVHAELVRLGFLEYVQAMKDAGEAKLFPALHRGGRRSPGEVFTEYFRDYRAAQGVTTPLATFHSLRHNVRSALVAAGVTEPVCDDLLGHAQTGSTGRKRYTHLDLGTLAAGIERLAYPFLMVPRVCVYSAHFLTDAES